MCKSLNREGTTTYSVCMYAVQPFVMCLCFVDKKTKKKKNGLHHRHGVILIELANEKQFEETTNSDR